MKTLDEFLEEMDDEAASRASGGDSEEDYGEESAGMSEPGSVASGSEQDYDSEDGSGSSYGSEGSSGYSEESDREYTGDMFAKR